MNKKNLIQYTIGLPALILASWFVLTKYKVSFQFKLDLLEYLWRPEI